MWLNYPDKKEFPSSDFSIQDLNINDLEIGWATDHDRIELEKKMKSGIKLPLILVEKKGSMYVLHDGQHRYAAYRNVFPNLKTIKSAVFHV